MGCYCLARHLMLLLHEHRPNSLGSEMYLFRVWFTVFFISSSFGPHQALA
jgi:hypothetical protein